MQFDLEAAKRLPPNIRFGTSTWTYPGWKGTIYYREYKSEKQFNATSLEEYANFPLFRTVGIDSTFYGPPKPATLASYAGMVPPEFLWVSKVWERVTIPKYPSHPRYGKLSGKDNPDFLNAELFVENVLQPYAEVKRHTGPFVFQFPAIARSVLGREQFFERAEAFLAALPREFRYAFEVRNPYYLEARYFELLNRHGATHCFNHWDRMPPLKTQMKAAAAAGGLESDFYVVRVLTPLGVSYEQAVSLFSPYDRIQRENPEMRDDVLQIVKRSLQTKKTAFIIVNNRAEGNAPGTIDSITRRAAALLDETTPAQC